MSNRCVVLKYKVTKRMKKIERKPSKSQKKFCYGWMDLPSFRRTQSCIEDAFKTYENVLIEQILSLKLCTIFSPI